MKQVAIIGAGPAGIAVAIQLRRYGIHPLLLEKNEVGGLLRNAHLVENYPGFPNGISGTDLVHLFRQQLTGANLNIAYEEVLKLTYAAGAFTIKTAKSEIQPQIVVVATGTKPRKITDVNIHKAAHDRIYYEVYHIAAERGKHITVVGAGDAAFDYALHLARKNQVTIMNRGGTVRCLPLLQDRAMSCSGITYMPNTEIRSIDRDDASLRIVCRNDGERMELRSDYVLFAIGREPQLDCITEELQGMKDALVEQGTLHYIGDVVNGSMRQVAIAVGDGVRTAMQIAQGLAGDS